MSILISHRGNINGPNKDRENHPDYINEALKAGYRVEVDIRVVDGKIFLGHDKPQYEVDIKYLVNDMLYLHCKDIATLEYISDYCDNRSMMSKVFQYEFPDFFFHDIDEAVLTYYGNIWTYPGKVLNRRSICVLPELNNLKKEDIKFCYGICSDYIINYK